MRNSRHLTIATLRGTLRTLKYFSADKKNVSFRFESTITHFNMKRIGESGLEYLFCYSQVLVRHLSAKAYHLAR